MENLVAERARAIFKSAEIRRQIADQCPLLSEAPEMRENILKFSQFLTSKGEKKWSDVNLELARSFLILSEYQDDGVFNPALWINSMRLFFDYLISNGLVTVNIFSNEEALTKEDLEEKIAPERKCLRCGLIIERGLGAKYCTGCSLQVKKELTLNWNKSHPDQVKKAIKAWNQRNKDYRRQLSKKWKEKNREKVREYRRRYRQRRAAKKRQHVPVEGYQEVHKEFHSLAELARAINYSRQGVYLLAKNKKIKTQAIAGHAFIPDNEFHRIVALVKNKGKFNAFPRGE